jgi:ParB-like chromosome segregation protein Spo0J
LTTLRVRLLDADERTAKAARYGRNGAGRRRRDWEAAWIVYALVRDDGLSQLEVAELLGRHKSWVSRRLALLEKLADEVRADLRLGLLSTPSPS